MWQFAEAIRGLVDGCLELGIPVTGGNVSFYNQTGETAILPTPVVGVLGVIDDVTRRTPGGFVAAGETVLLLGETREELAGSEWAHVVHEHLGGLPPGGRPGAREGAGRAAARGGRAGDQRARPVRRRPGAGASRVGAAPRHRRAGSARRRPVRRAVLGVRRAGAGHGADRRRRAATALAGRHGVPVAELGTTGGGALVVEGSFEWRSRCCATPGRARCPTPWAESRLSRDAGAVAGAEVEESVGVSPQVGAGWSCGSASRPGF